MKISIEDLYKSERGIKTHGGKVYYPVKTRTCRNCYLRRYDNVTHLPDGCWEFGTEFINGVQKPTGICIPVRTNSIDNPLFDLRVEQICIWIMENLEK